MTCTDTSHWVPSWISWTLTCCSIKSSRKLSNTFSRGKYWHLVPNDHKHEMWSHKKMFAEIWMRQLPVAREFSSSCCGLNDQQLKQNPLRCNSTQRMISMYKSCSTNPAASKSNWFLIAFTKGPCQDHQQIGLMDIHPLLGSSRTSCSAC